MIGTSRLPNGQCEFTLWAPLLTSVNLQLWPSAASTMARSLPMQKRDRGYWQLIVEDAPPGTLYAYQINGETVRPDPASQCQPEGVHGRSQIVDHTTYLWQDTQWQNLPLTDYCAYEIHVGTFTPEGTFEAIIPRLPELKALGITAIEIMPVAQFPGDRNWGYDGAYPFAVQLSYGGINGFKRLVDACHQNGLALILDVVYNHFGPEGNYTREFAPYFTDRYNTPWGAAMNFDDADSDGVRNFFVENVLYWLRDFHVDALRLDAIHAIYDFGAKHILQEFAEAVAAWSKQQKRPYYLIAESDLNDVRVIRPWAQGGYGIDAQWSDDFHHALHTVLTGEQTGYYQDFGTVEQLAKAWQQSFVYDWQYSAFRRRFHGSDGRDRAAYQFMICAQNHDQVGNRMLGERLTQLTRFEGLKLAAANVILAPSLPLLFMGEEYGETAPFLYFISHTDSDLVQAVREGRKREFAAFHLEGEPPDAASVDTFQRCVLNWDKRHEQHHGILWNFYQELFQLRRSRPALKNFARGAIAVQTDAHQNLLTAHRWTETDAVFIVCNWHEQAVTVRSLPPGNWHKQLDSADPRWQGSGCTLPDRATSEQTLTMPAWSVALYVQEAA